MMRYVLAWFLLMPLVGVALEQNMLLLQEQNVARLDNSRRGRFTPTRTNTRGPSPTVTVTFNRSGSPTATFTPTSTLTPVR